MKEESKENDNISIQKEKDTSKKDILDYEIPAGKYGIPVEKL